MTLVIFKTILMKLKEYLKNLNDINSLEIEFRLGIKFPDKFSSNITEKYYNIIKKKLDKSSSKGIFIKESSNSIDHFKNGIRKSITNDETIYITKKKLYTEDIVVDNSPMDIRISVSSEIPMTDFSKYFEEGSFTRTKERNSYIYKSWKYDLTKIITSRNSLDEITYEFEIEIIDYNDEDLIDKSIKKIYEIISFIKD